MKENNFETVTSLSSDLSTRENIIIQLEELLIAGNYDEAKLLLEPSQPVDIADAIGSLPLILQALAFRLIKKNEAIEVYEYLDPVVQQTLLERLRSGEVLEIVEKMSPDDREFNSLMNYQQKLYEIFWLLLVLVKGKLQLNYLDMNQRLLED